MKRFAYQDLINWKNNPHRKPLILLGARQVGKTWLLREFGKNEYTNVAYISCDNVRKLREAFFDFNPKRLVETFETYTQEEILPGKTLIILDEIQEAPYALTALKYFCEEAPEYHIAVAGSLLGLNLHTGSGFPVGKVDFLHLYPLTFMEFLDAMGEKGLFKLLSSHRWEEAGPFRTHLIDQLRRYYLTGGMPAVVKDYAETHNQFNVRELQRAILAGYVDDFSKHAAKPEAIRIAMVWQSLPSQLAKENKKFVYGALKKGGRAKEFECAIDWLIRAGLVHKVNRVNNLELPLKFYEDFSCFKLFACDLGLLGALADVPPEKILIGDGAFSDFKGSFTEQFVAQQLCAVLDRDPFYYTNGRSTLEIDFAIQTDRVLPVEVKAETNLRSKSLSTVLGQYPDLNALRFSMSDYKEQDRLVNVPLYMCEEYVRDLIVQERLALASLLGGAG